MTATSLSLKLNKLMRIFVYTSYGGIIKISIEPSDTIKVLKEKIQLSEGLAPDNQKLVFVGKKLAGKFLFEVELEDTCTVSDYNIQDGSRLVLTEVMKLFLHESLPVPPGSSGSINVEPTWTVARLKEKILKKIPFPCPQQLTVVLGKKAASSEKYVFCIPLLDLNVLVSNYPLQDGCILNLMVKHTISIRCNNQELCIQMPINATLKQLKEKIWKKTGIPEVRQGLTCMYGGLTTRREMVAVYMDYELPSLVELHIRPI